jgi:hypothetical protein
VLITVLVGAADWLVGRWLRTGVVSGPVGTLIGTFAGRNVIGLSEGPCYLPLLICRRLLIGWSVGYR